MSEPQFTKGPWQLRKGTSIVEGGARFDVAIVVGSLSGGRLVTEYARANARLIAAAPALYAALKATGIETEVPCDYDHHGNCQAHTGQPKGECYVEIGLAALALAEGKQS